MFQQLQFYLGIAIAVGLLAWHFWPTLQRGFSTALQWATRPIGSTSTIGELVIGTVELDPDTQAFQAVKLLHGRFSDSGSTEGVAAAEVCLGLLLRKGAQRSA